MEAHANLGQLVAQLSSCSDEQKEALASTSERFQKEQRDWQGRLDFLEKELDDSQAESQASRQRVAVFEADIAKLKNTVSEYSTANAEMADVVADLQELDRRRDTYLTSIMRRYRDITIQFRTMSGVLNSSRDANCNALSGAALTNIQNTVSLSDDDLRQLNELNTQARQLENKLARKLSGPPGQSSR
jgi:chromosome segregation ATPase